MINEIIEANKIIEAYVEDIIDNALKFIPNENHKEFIINLMQITLIHKKEVDIYIKNKEVKNE